MAGNCFLIKKKRPLDIFGNLFTMLVEVVAHQQVLFEN